MSYDLDVQKLLIHVASVDIFALIVWLIYLRRLDFTLLILLCAFIDDIASRELEKAPISKLEFKENSHRVSSIVNLPGSSAFNINMNGPQTRSAETAENTTLAPHCNAQFRPCWGKHCVMKKSVSRGKMRATQERDAR